MKKISDYEILDHGIDRYDYFPGCGIALTGFDFIVTGSGSNFMEAIEDALDQLAECDYDTTSNKELNKDVNTLKSKNNISVLDCNNSEACDDFYYYVSIRIKTKTKTVKKR